MKKVNKKIKGIKKYQFGGPDWQQQMTQNLLGKADFSNFGPTVEQKANLGMPDASPATKGTGLGNVAGGIGKAAGVAQGVTGLIGMMSGPSTATTKGEAVQQSIQNVVGGVATGAQAGAAFGPVGAIVGGAAGLAAGLTGKKGNVTEGGFYEDPTMTLGTGLRGAFSNKGIRKKYEAAKKLAGEHRIGASIGAQAQADWAEDYDQDVTTMAYGGEIPNNLAYVDDGELINTPDIGVVEIPEEGKPTDSNLVSLPEGSRILSDKLKMPGTKETFAQVGKKMMSKKKTKGKDKYAENSAKLNQMNDQIIHNKLFEIQESIKSGKRNGNGVPRFEKGGTKLKNTVNKIGSWMKNQDWGNVASTVSQLAPALSNMNATAERFDTVNNPYAGTIMNTMAGRKFNISPAKRAIRDNTSVSNYNAAQFNPTTGANMAYRLQSNIAANKAVSDLYAQKSNVENQYKGDYANTLNNLGQQFVGARNMSIDQNARSRAAADNIKRTGMTQLSQYFQNQDLMRNQKNRDSAMLDAYSPFLESVYKSGDYNNLMKKFRRG